MATRVRQEIDPKTAPVPDQKFINLVELDHIGASGLFKTAPWPERKVGGVLDVPTPVIKLNANTSRSTTLKLPPALEVVVETSENVGRGPRVKPRKVASVIPARRKLVKTMMYEWMVEFITSSFARRPPKPNSDGDDDAIIDGS